MFIRRKRLRDVMKTLNVMGFDLGASSGRGILGSFDGDKLTLREIHRFPHNFTIMNGHAFWNVLSLYDAMKESLRLCPEKLDGMGFDTWGVDCGVLDAQGNLLGLPMSYRDAALDDDNMRQVLDELGAEYLCEQTGIANLAYNTLYKLSYLKREMPAQLESADRILFMPNLFEYLFSGVAHAEYSIASTSQLFNMREKRWACEIMDKLGFHRDWFPEVDCSGKILGKVRADVGEQTGQPQAAVISVAGHDTACAVAAVPSAEEEFTFLSCGTWSLLGVSARQMMDTQAVLRDQISNEGTCDGGYRPTVNIIGMWIFQELRRNFQKQGKDYSFPQMTELARKAAPLRSFIRPDDFMQPGDYTVKIRAYCEQTGQHVPEDDGELARCVLESLAMKYRQVYESLRPYITWDEKLYVVGGGVQNDLLMECAANALGIPVILGASEATAVGNIMEQLRALGAYHTRDEKCQILDRSFCTTEVRPMQTEAWEQAYQRFEALYQ